MDLGTHKGKTLIAEVKTISPYSKTRSPYNADELFNMAAAIGDIVSIHTDPLWGGSMQSIWDYRGKQSKSEMMILAKGIHREEADIVFFLNEGADYVLTYDYFDSRYDTSILVEVSSLESLKSMVDKFTSNTKVVWNTRDLRTGGPKIINGTTNFYKQIEMVKKIWPGYLCVASNITRLFGEEVDDELNLNSVFNYADAAIVGTNLPKIYLEMLLKNMIPWNKNHTETTKKKGYYENHQRS